MSAEIKNIQDAKILDAKHAKDLSFEDAMNQLESIVKQLEEGRFPLEDAMTAFENGMQLKKICEDKLKSAQLKIEKVLEKGDETRLEPFA